MRKSRLHLKPVDPTSNRAAFSVYFGWSRRRSISSNLQSFYFLNKGAAVLPMASIEELSKINPSFTTDRSATAVTTASSRNIHLSELNISQIENYNHIPLEGNLILNQNMIMNYLSGI